MDFSDCQFNQSERPTSCQTHKRFYLTRSTTGKGASASRRDPPNWSDNTDLDFDFEYDKDCSQWSMDAALLSFDQETLLWLGAQPWYPSGRNNCECVNGVTCSLSTSSWETGGMDFFPPGTTTATSPPLAGYGDACK